MPKRRMENMFKPTPVPNTSRAKQGAAGFDNARENIDPHIKTKVVSTKEINTSKIITNDLTIVFPNTQIHTVENEFLGGSIHFAEIVFTAPAGPSIGSIKDVLYVRGADRDPALLFSNADITEAANITYDRANEHMDFKSADEYSFDADVTVSGDIILNGTSNFECNPLPGGKLNLFIGTDVGGADNISHSSGDEGYGNTGIGEEVLYSITTGAKNIAIGYRALYAGTSQEESIAIGANCMDLVSSFTTRCVAIGNQALRNVGTQGDVTAIGFGAMRNCTTGIHNTAIGKEALKNIGSGNGCVAIGQEAGEFLEDGDYNTLVGEDAIVNCVSGEKNTVLGAESGATLTSGNGNILIGYGADVPTPTTSNYINIDGVFIGDISTGNVAFQNKIYHQGDTDTYMYFGDAGNILYSVVGNFHSIYQDANGVRINNEHRDKDFLVKGDADQELLFVDGGEDNVGIGTVTPTTKLSVEEKGGMTPIGGFAIKLTNKTGANTIKGQQVKADTANNDAVILTAIGDTECFGVFLDAGIADGAEAWVVVSGIADVALDDNVASVRGNWMATGVAAGYARTSASPAAAPQHFEEIGHCIETVAAAGAGNHILARCILHFL